MKKNFLVYSACWLILLAIFNVIIFVTPNEIAGVSKFSGGFWVGYGFSNATFIGHLVCSWFALNTSDNRKFFYNLPLITISFTALILNAVISIVFMAVPQIPAWIAAIICSLILAFGAIAVIKAKAAAKIVATVDEKVKVSTSFIRELIVQANGVVSRAQTPSIKQEAQKVYEALRYIDPTSSAQLSSIESEISNAFGEFEKLVTENDEAGAKEVASALIILINERANTCKLFKKN